MNSALVRVLYQSLLYSARQLERDVIAGRTLYNAIRSGAIDAYDEVKIDWQRERRYENRLRDAKAIQRWSNKPTTAATLVRTQFKMPLDTDNRLALHHRLNQAFEVLREIDDHNALVRDLLAQGAFVPKRRSANIQFRVGDIVEVEKVGVGVIVSWSEGRAHAYGELHVTYEVLPDTAYHSDRGRLHRVPQSEIRLAVDPKPVQHPSVLIYFDGFVRGRHLPCSSLAQRYPDDIPTELASRRTETSIPPAPSILQLQFADEHKLVQYLRCDDTTVVQLATAALEGKWISECGDDAQRRVRDTLKQMDRGNLGDAKEMLLAVVEEYPNYAYGWSKLGNVQLKTGDVAEALKAYERASRLKPSMLDALAGMGTCATRMRRWHVAHNAAMQLLAVQPDNETAFLLLNNAILSSL